MLGICYGMQLLARALLGDAHVRRSATPEIGWLPVEVLPGHEALYAGRKIRFAANSTVTWGRILLRIPHAAKGHPSTRSSELRAR